MKRPKIFFDTSICIDVKSRIPRAEWTLVQNKIFETFRYCVSPFTVYELASGLDTANDEHFRLNCEPFSVLYPTRRKSILPVLMAFVPMQLFGERRRISNSINIDFDLWIRAILLADSSEYSDEGDQDSELIVISVPGLK